MTNTLAYLLPRAALVSQQSRIGKLTSGRPYVSFITGQSAEWTIPYLGLFQGGDISLVIQYATSATSGTVKLSAAIEAISDGDYPVSTLTSFGSATDGEQSLSGQAWQLRSFNCPFSDVDGMNQGRLIRIKITRETDSCTEPVFIVGATLQETLSSFNVDGELILSNPLAVESGGTGATDSTQALTNLLPDQTGNDGYFLQTASGSPQWAELALGDLAYASAPLQASQGGTGLTSLAAHRVLYGAQFGGQAEQSADLTFTASTKRLDLAGSQVITNQVASTIPFRIHGTASQTGLLTDWRNSSNQSVASVSASGTVAATNITTPTETITGTVAATVPLTVQGAVSQSADFVQVKDSSNAKVFAIHADKSVLIPPASTIGQDQTLQYKTDGTQWGNAELQIRRDRSSNNGMGTQLKLTDNNVSAYIKFFSRSFTQAVNDLEFHSQGGLNISMPYTGGTYIYNPVTNTQYPALLTAPAQTIAVGGGAPSPIGAFVFESVTYGATSANSVTDAASLLIKSAPTQGTNMTLSNRYGGLILTGSATAKGLAVRGAGSQSANLQEWQDSSSSVLAAVRPNGGIKPAHLADTAAANDTIYYSTDASKLVYKDSAGTVNNLY